MRKILITILFLLLILPSVMSQSVAFKNESLNYKIIYHWGLIWKHAGSATLTLKMMATRLMPAWRAALVRGLTKCLRFVTLCHAHFIIRICGL